MHNVVTEYGIARLKGKSIRERANELIAVAHPDFRNELRAEAKADVGLSPAELIYSGRAA